MVKLSRDHRKYVHGPRVGKAFTLRVPEPVVKTTKTGKKRVTLDPAAPKRTFKVIPRARVDVGGYYHKTKDIVYVDAKMDRKSQRGVAIHEATEKMLRDKGLPYDSTPKRRVAAHQLANKAEKRAVGKRQFRRETLSAFRAIAANVKARLTRKR